MKLRHVAALLIVAMAGCGSQPRGDRSVVSKQATSTAVVAVDPVQSVEARTYLAAPQYFIAPAPTGQPTFSISQIRQLAPQLSDRGTLQQIVLGYFHDSANDPTGANPPLVYLVTFAQPACVPSSNAPPGVTGSPVIALPCNVFVVVDATTGDQIVSLAGG